MDGLRWLLLLFGLLVIVGVYVYSRREREPRKPVKPVRRGPPRVEPSFDEPPFDEPGAPAWPEDDSGSALESTFESESESEPETGADGEGADEEAPRPREKIVTLRVVAKNHGSFPGDELALGLRGVGMRHGRMGIFHRVDADDEDKVVFSAASLVEPGSFDLQNLKSQRIPGISLFMVLPGPIDGAAAYDLMVAAGRALAKSLYGELLDESGSTLSIQRERYLREEVIQYQHRIKVA